MGEMKPKLLELIPNERVCIVKGARERNGVGGTEEKKLELRLGLPCEEYWSANRDKREGLDGNVKPVLSLGFFGCSEPNQEGLVNGVAQKMHGKGDKQQSIVEKKACGPHEKQTYNTRVANSPVVGWPPVRSFRRNIASTSKTISESQKQASGTETKFEDRTKGLFVKINMDGVPIGRKVDLTAYDSYDKLACAVDQLFRGLLADQRAEIGTEKNMKEKSKAIKGLLDGRGEYTLVYDDEEGDKMLVGDVPWEMFVCTAKRLRVLKSSDLSASSLKRVCRKRAATEC